jgi:hypothetical protein
MVTAAALAPDCAAKLHVQQVAGTQHSRSKQRQLRKAKRVFYLPAVRESFIEYSGDNFSSKLHLCSTAVW